MSWVVLAWLAISLWAFAVITALATHVAALIHPWLRRAPAVATRQEPRPVTLLIPVSSLPSSVDPGFEATLGTIAGIHHHGLEVIFCVPGADDPAVPLIRDLLASHPAMPAHLLSGDMGAGPNPKINNLRKGYERSRGEIIVFADQNMVFTPDYLSRLLERLDRDVGLVSCPVIGSQPASFWGRVECAFLNGYATRFMILADSVGQGFAQGVTMLMRKADLQRAGGLAALESHLTDDNAATATMRALGLRVVMEPQPAIQLIGRRRPADVWRRHLRWAFFRRCSYPWLTMGECLTGAILPGALGAWATGILIGGSPGLFFAAHLTAWLAVEAVVSGVRGWTFSPLASLTRELLLPPIWLWARLARHVRWQGRPLPLMKARAAQVSASRLTRND